MTRDFTPVQEILLQAIKVASLRFQAPEITLLRKTLDELADRLDEWAIASRPVTVIDSNDALRFSFVARERGQA